MDDQSGHNGRDAVTTKQLIAFAWLIGPGAAFSAAAGTITVTSYSDTTANDGQCTLREAITAANTNTASGAAAGECVAGSTGLDTIVFDVLEFCPIGGCTISLVLDLPDISSAMSIVGPGADSLIVQPAAGARIRIFNVSTGSATIPTSISGFTIRNGDTRDVDGGGGVRNAAPVLNLTNCLFQNNKTSGTSNSPQGGGLLNAAGTVNVTNCTFNQGAAIRGAGIFNNGTLNVADSIFTANVAGTSNNNGQGGGIAASSLARTTVTNCSFTDNFAGERGGAIIALGTNFTVTGSTFTGNKSSIGGAISNFGTCNVVNSAMAGNMAGQVAGGFFVGFGGAVENFSGTVSLTNTTISGNVTDSRGGGIYNQAALNVTNSTITGNSTTGMGGLSEGGGIHSLPSGGPFSTNPVTTIKSSIVALNSSTTSPDVAGNVASNGFNLIGKTDGSTGFTAATDHAGTIAAPLDPKLDPNGLQNNGGVTQTIALLLGSPAIDKGTSAGLTGNLATDQRGSGFPRIYDDSAVANAAGGDGTDIGAFELQIAQPTKLANISTRLRVETGDNVLIGGFIITGTQDKKVIIRAIGPSLSQFFAGTLENPTLELRDSSGALLESNDNWVSSPNKQAIIDSTIPPTDDLESAIVRSLPANNESYTAIVRGLNNGTGIGVVEAFDLDTIADSKLANISTRGFVQTGDNILIAGTIILGRAAQKVIVRAIGPSLSVPGKLENPTLELRDQNGGLVDANDNWVDSPNKQAIIDSTIPPTNDLESAIAQTLGGNGASYTAILRGVNNTTGIAVVEVFALQ
jgi:CSLREA domain-containing protein